MSTLTQTINSKGTFSVKPPYNSVIIADAVYTVVDMGLLSTMLKRDSRLENTIYFQFNTDVSVFNNDIAKDVVIVILEDVAGRQFHIPEYAFLSVAKNDGVYYQHTVLTVEMGAHEVDVDVTVLKQALSDNVHNLYGIVPRITEFKTSDKRMIPESEHKIILNRRALVKSDSSNYKLLLEESLVREEALKTELEKLKQFVLDNFN